LWHNNVSIKGAIKRGRTHYVLKTLAGNVAVPILVVTRDWTCDRARSSMTEGAKVAIMGRRPKVKNLPLKNLKTY